MPSSRRAIALVAALLAVLSAASGAHAQTSTRGSPLAAAPNTTFGCDAAPSLPPLGSSDFAVRPAGLPSCTWWSTGPAGTVGSPNTGYVPTTGTITNVRVRSGPTPAPLRLVQLRSTAGCCTVVRQTDVFQPTPNDVTTVTVNWLTEAVRDSVAGVSTNDIIGFSAAAGTGSLPVLDQGPGTHTPQAAFAPGIMGAGFTAPAAQPGALITAATVGPIGYEVLLQYDFVPCPALNNVPIAPGTVVCPGQTTVTTPGGAPQGPVALALTTARLTGSTLPLAIVCNLDAGCAGRLSLLLAAGARTATTAASSTLATTTFSVKKGKRAVKVRLSKRARARLRRAARTRVTAVVTIPGQPKVRTTFTVRR